MKTESERFFKKIKMLPNGCIIWIGAKTHDGYGIFKTTERINTRVHRFSFKKYKEPLIRGLVIDHICRNRACVNPEHLRQVTLKVNALENSSGIAYTNKIKNKCCNGHNLGGENLSIYIKPRGKTRVCKICQRKYVHKYKQKRKMFDKKR